jgi:hypothetical protein
LLIFFVDFQSPYSEVQQEVFIRFWKLKRPQLQESLFNKSKWNDSLVQFSWRIDIKTKSKHCENLNEPTAIVELNIGKPNTVRFLRNEKCYRQNEILILFI